MVQTNKTCKLLNLDRNTWSQITVQIFVINLVEAIIFSNIYFISIQIKFFHTRIDLRFFNEIWVIPR